MFGVRVWNFLFAFFLIVLWAAAPLRAQSGATDQVRSVLDKAMDIQTKPELQGPEHRKERAAQIRKLISENFLSAEMARESLQGHWEKLSAKQREQYQALFTGIFTDSYSRRVLDFLKRETIEYPGETPEGKYIKVQHCNNANQRAHPGRLYTGAQRPEVDDQRCDNRWSRYCRNLS